MGRPAKRRAGDKAGTSIKARSVKALTKTGPWTGARSRHKKWCSLATLGNILWCCDSPVRVSPCKTSAWRMMISTHSAGGRPLKRSLRSLGWFCGQNSVRVGKKREGNDLEWDRL